MQEERREHDTYMFWLGFKIIARLLLIMLNCFRDDLSSVFPLLKAKYIHEPLKFKTCAYYILSITCNRSELWNIFSLRQLTEYVFIDWSFQNLHWKMSNQKRTSYGFQAEHTNTHTQASARTHTYTVAVYRFVKFRYHFRFRSELLNNFSTTCGLFYNWEYFLIKNRKSYFR